MPPAASLRAGDTLEVPCAAEIAFVSVANAIAAGIAAGETLRSLGAGLADRGSAGGSAFAA